MKRTFNGRRLTEVANHPKVRPYLGRPEKGPLDLHELVANPANLSFCGEQGGFVLERVGPGLFEAHSMVAPEGRGGLTAETSAILDFAFTATDAIKVVTRIPNGNAPADRLARASGFTPVGLVDHDGHEVLEISAEAWLLRADERPAKERLRTVLAACVRAGNPDKGLWFWSVMAPLMRVAPLRILSRFPLVLDVEGEAWDFTGEPEVIECL